MDIVEIGEAQPAPARPRQQWRAPAAVAGLLLIVVAGSWFLASGQYQPTTTFVRAGTELSSGTPDGHRGEPAATGSPSAATTPSVVATPPTTPVATPTGTSRHTTSHPAVDPGIPNSAPYPEATVRAAAVDQMFDPIGLRKVTVSVDVTASPRASRVTVTVHWRDRGADVGTSSHTFTGSGHFEATMEHEFQTCGVSSFGAHFDVSASQGVSYSSVQDVTLAGWICNG